MSKILVVDDEPVNVQVALSLLSAEAHYETRAVHSGVEALDLLENGYRPDLILLDVMMPKLSGYDVLRRLRKRFPAVDLPVILLTAKTQVSDLIQGFEAGANDYVTKPIAKGELLSRLKTHLQLSKVYAAYARFVPHEFIRHLAHESIIEVKLGDQVAKEMTVLFSDIRSFTELSEDMNPRENFNFLNSFLSRVAPVIAEHRGFIDQYIGDAVMALFPHRAADAVRGASGLRRAVRLYNLHRAQSGYRAIRLGTGLHSGPLILGTIGYEQRMQTTVIADTVNQASRLEGVTKYFGVEVLLSQAVVERLSPEDDLQVRPLGKMRVKGKREPIAMFELLTGAEGAELEGRLKTQELFETAVRYLSAGEPAEAEKAFAQVVRQDEGDIAAKRLLERARYLVEHPEERNQDGELVERRQ